MALSSPVRLLIRNALLVAALLAMLVLGVPASSATPSTTVVPAAGELAWAAVRVRESPAAGAMGVATISQFRPDFLPTIIHAIATQNGPSGRWYRVRLAGRPNGRTGWIPAAALEYLHPLHMRVAIDRSQRVLRLYKDGQRVFTARVAVGKPGAETPLGHFYITARYVPSNSFLGVYALETSAYSRLSDWPGGGIIGLHGTYLTQLLGQAVSHGCVRMSNSAVLTLKRLAPVGTPVDIVA